MKLSLLPALFAVVACGGEPQKPAAEDPSAPAAPAPGEPILIDGSSTVFPIAEAIAEEFQKKFPGRRVTVGTSGTGGGFKKFCAGEIAIANASRPIKPTEVETCKAAGIEFIELPVAYDGLAVVVNPEATWVDSMTVAELKTIWEPEAQGKITRWNQVRKEWPDQELHLFGAGVDSGTYDYFTQAVTGKEHSSRGDYTSSEDDNVLVQGVSSDKSALGFFGLAYLEENKGKLKAIAIDDGKAENGDGPVMPSVQAVRDGTYQPLSRPLFIYVSVKDAARPEVSDLVKFAMNEGKALVGEVGYVALPDNAYGLVAKRFEEKTTGSVFAGGGSQVGFSIDQLLAAEGGAAPAAPASPADPAAPAAPAAEGAVAPPAAGTK